MITIVSGLPRSCTSLIMQMLQKGGMQILTDNVRKPDENNLKGYFEYDKIKALQRDSSWLHEAEGKAVKVIAQLLKYLPGQFEYKIIFIERNMEEILNSQQKMLENLGMKKTTSNSSVLAKTFRQQIQIAKNRLSQQDNISVLYIQHREAITNPHQIAQKINTFLQLNLNEEQMAHAVDQSLYRQRVR